MKTIQKYIALFILAAMLSMTFVSPALAFDGRGEDTVVIESNEVINDDLYVTAEEFTLEGTVKGDLIVFANYIRINGTVEGDLIAAGNTIVVNGTVKDDVRIAGAALQFGEAAVIGSDAIGASASLEAKNGSEVGGDLVYAGAQALLAGSVGDDVQVAAGGLEIQGTVGGDVLAELGEGQKEGSPSPAMYVGDTQVDIPSVASGLTIGDQAKIGGSLTYTQTVDSDIPAESVTGKITRNEPVVDEFTPAPPSTGELVTNWVLNLFRSIATLAIFGLLLAWLAPAFLKGLAEKLQEQPVPSFGWGIVAYAAFFFALLVIVVTMVVAGIIFGVISLGGVTATIIFIGIFAIFALILGFALFTGFGAQILTAWMGGKWILGRFNPALAEHKFWPMLLGVALVGLLVNLPGVGWLFAMLIMFFGLGALWLWGRERMSKPVVNIE